MSKRKSYTFFDEFHRHDGKDAGPLWLILVESPHWPGAVLQFVQHEWWYGHKSIEEFEADTARDGCKILHMELCTKPYGNYLSDEEVDQRLRRHRSAQEAK